MKDPRGAFAVVDMFEAELADYTGAPYAVAVDSCTNAIFLALCCHYDDRLRLEAAAHFEAGGTLEAFVPSQPTIGLPRRTYVGVAQAARNAGCAIEWRDEAWTGSHKILNTPVVDSAKSFHRGMYEPGTLTCVSFQACKILPIGRGGAILHDNPAADEWLRRARFDGRTEGDRCDSMTQATRPGFHVYMLPEQAARGLHLLMYLDDNPADQVDEYPDLSLLEWA